MPLKTFTSPLLPAVEDPLAKVAEPLKRSDAVTAPVLRDSKPEPLDTPLPVRMLMKPPEEEER